MPVLATRLLLALAFSLAALAGEARPAAPPAGSRYVALGSSFAAGPGVTRSADTPPNRCQRSNDNYAHQLARKRNLSLVDVSCGGATTAHMLAPWGELPPQLDAVTPDTRLVTVTVGGNDVEFIGGLLVASCLATAEAARPSLCRFLLDNTGASAPAPTAEQWAKVQAGLEMILREVRRRAPAARVVFVDYLTVLPDNGLCAQTPLSPAAAAAARETAGRLAKLTARVAARGGAEMVRASELSRGHDACAGAPWMSGFTPPPGAGRFMPYHPNLAGMTAVADALDRLLGG